MKTFYISAITIFSLLFAAYVPSSAQQCNVKLTGTLCKGDTISSSDSLQAIFSGGTLSSLVWLWDGNEYTSGGPVFYSTVETKAGEIILVLHQIYSTAHQTFMLIKLETFTLPMLVIIAS